MREHTLYIKNMVCPRCIQTVRGIFSDLEIEIKSIKLGEVLINSPVEEKHKHSLMESLEKDGFELLQDQKSKLIGQIKSLIIDQVHYEKEPLKINFSSYLSEELNHEYSALSRLFSSVEGITIERFILMQRIEKVKEYIFYDELSLSEIANRMNYSSVAYLSSQFKKETGMTPSAFKKFRKPGHSSLDGF